MRLSISRCSYCNFLWVLERLEIFLVVSLVGATFSPLLIYFWRLSKDSPNPLETVLQILLFTLWKPRIIFCSSCHFWLLWEESHSGKWLMRTTVNRASGVSFKAPRCETPMQCVWNCEQTFWGKGFCRNGIWHNYSWSCQLLKVVNTDNTSWHWRLLLCAGVGYHLQISLDTNHICSTRGLALPSPTWWYVFVFITSLGLS